MTHTPYIQLVIVTHPTSESNLSTGLIHIEADGPSGRWSHTLSTDFATSFVATLDSWPQVAASWSPQAAFETRTACPLEGQLHLCLASTSTGPVVLAAPHHGERAVTPVTAVPAAQDEIERFVTDMHAMTEGTGLFARLGRREPPSALTVARPAVELTTTGVNAYLPGQSRSLSTRLTLDELSQAAQALSTLAQDPAPPGTTHVLLEHQGLRVSVLACEGDQSPLPLERDETVFRISVDTLLPYPTPLWHVWSRRAELARSATSFIRGTESPSAPKGPRLTLWASVQE
ncbi:hypothetical protein [Actinomyces faecalis]|uniref:hypothetical protein n=1 Tax=Actinomyces faecalis TaxID=2722820 RepID=UPI0015566089|nr:hypothetical protein [Actinomyces faecalis]